MYIVINETRYTAKNPRISKPTGRWWRISLPDGAPETVAGSATLYSDDGDVLAAFDTADWLRVTVSSGGLLLTNEPEPEPTPEPEPPAEPEPTLEERVTNCEQAIEAIITEDTGVTT